MSKLDIEGLNNTLKQILGKSLTNTLPLVITDTTAHTNINAMAIYAISNATFTTLNTINQGDSLTSQTLNAGNIWYVPINGTVKLATGAVIIYQHEPSGN